MGYTFAPYIKISGFTLPNVKFIGYDKHGNAKFIKTK